MRTFSFSLLVMSLITGCHHSSSSSVDQGNQCFNEKLEFLKKTGLYKNIVSAFDDTFRVMKNDLNDFGQPSLIENKIDDAIFLKNDSSECLLLVLQKPKGIDTSNTFGIARVIRGIRTDRHWKFELNRLLCFPRDYFKEYAENSFENISRIARYSIITLPKPSKEKCAIDDAYWFTALK
jgi:hypothetical protein